MNALSGIATNLVLNDEGIWVARNQRAVSYPAEGNETYFSIEENSFWFKHRNAVIGHLVQAFPPDGPLFDVGGGNGYVSLALQQAGIETALIEPGRQGALNAKKRGLSVVIHSTLEDADFKKDAVTAFGLFDVLEHIEDDSAFLQTLHDCLVQDGWLYLTVPAYNALWSVDDERDGHFRRYTRRMLIDRLKAVGFRVAYCSYFFSILAPAILALRSIPSRLRLRRSVPVATTEREHALPSGLPGRVIERCLSFELNRIKKGQRLPVGSSCIVVARKSGPPPPGP